MEATFAQRASLLLPGMEGGDFCFSAQACLLHLGVGRGSLWFLHELGEIGGLRRACSTYPEKLLQGKVLLFSAQNVQIRASELSERDLTGLSAQALGSVKKLSVGLAVFLP